MSNQTPRASTASCVLTKDTTVTQRKAVMKEVFVLTLANGGDEDVVPLACVEVDPEDQLLERHRCLLKDVANTLVPGSGLHLQHLQQEERVRGVQVGLRMACKDAWLPF